MPLRRAFLLGAATIVSVAALVAVVTVLNGSFGETEGKIFATLATTFVAGSMLIAGLACLGRGTSAVIAATGIGLSILGFLLWSAQIWGGYNGDGYWRLLGILTAWSLALLIMTTTRLLISSPSLVNRLYPLTCAGAALTALGASVGLIRQHGDGWQLFAVLLILTLLGETLAPILERYAAAQDRPAERVLGVLGNVEVLAVPSRGSRAVRIGGRAVELAPDESIVVRERA
jgi:hypothetical protein